MEVPLEEMLRLASGGEWLSWVGTSATKRCDARAVVVNRLHVVPEEDAGTVVAAASAGPGGAHALEDELRPASRRSWAQGVEIPGAPWVTAIHAGAVGTAEASLERLEEGLALALTLDRDHARARGGPHPLFEAPAAGLYMLADLLCASRKQAAEQWDIIAM